MAMAREWSRNMPMERRFIPFCAPVALSATGVGSFSTNLFIKPGIQLS
jgi:hypothetical protein